MRASGLKMHEEDCVTGRRGFRVWGKILDASTTTLGSSVNAQAQFVNSGRVIFCHVSRPNFRVHSRGQTHHVFRGGTHVDADVAESGPQGWVLAYLVFIYKLVGKPILLAGEKGFITFETFPQRIPFDWPKTKFIKEYLASCL